LNLAANIGREAEVGELMLQGKTERAYHYDSQDCDGQHASDTSDCVIDTRGGAGMILID